MKLPSSTGLPSYSDSFGTAKSCHCNQTCFTIKQSIGKSEKCHCKQKALYCLTVTSVTVSEEAITKAPTWNLRCQTQSINHFQVSRSVYGHGTWYKHQVNVIIFITLVARFPQWLILQENIIWFDFAATLTNVLIQQVTLPLHHHRSTERALESGRKRLCKSSVVGGFFPCLCGEWVCGWQREVGRIDPIIVFRPTSKSVDDSVDRNIFSVWRWICCEQEGSPIAEGTRGRSLGSSPEDRSGWSSDFPKYFARTEISVNTFLSGFGNGWLKYRDIVQF